VELTREQAALYRAATADTLARIGTSTGIARRGQMLRLLQSLRQIVRTGARSAAGKAVGPVGRIIRDAILSIAFRRAAKDGGKSMTWLQGHHIEFDQPVQPDRAPQAAR
jgi:hypothetical protein